jgi:hypothetical protein
MTAAWGKLQQVRCAECRYQWTLKKHKMEALFWGPRVHVSIDRLLKGIALMVLGLPMSLAEECLSIKAETLKARLVSLLDADRWEALDAVLEQRFGVPTFARAEFRRAVVIGREFDESSFRCWCKGFQHLSPAERSRSLRLAARIAGCSLEALRSHRRPKRKARQQSKLG